MAKKIKLPTAKELLKANFLLIEKDKTCEAHTHLVVDQMIAFAKMHVKAALESGAGKAKTKIHYIVDKIIVDKDSILNAYPDSNIK